MLAYFADCDQSYVESRVSDLALVKGYAYVSKEESLWLSVEGMLGFAILVEKDMQIGWVSS